MDNYAKIALVDNEIEAQLMDDILNDQKIPHVMRSYHDTAYNGIFQLQKGWGSIYAPESYRDEINTLLDDLRKAELTDIE
jgi:hypothetical protein